MGVKEKNFWYRRYGKRFMDIVLANIALLLLTPVALVVALAIRFTMGPPVIFRQVRPAGVRI